MLTSLTCEISRATAKTSTPSTSSKDHRFLSFLGGGTLYSAHFQLLLLLLLPLLFFAPGEAIRLPFQRSAYLTGH